MFRKNEKYTIHKLRLQNGCDMAYVDEGAGERTLLFVHGLATYSLSWTPLIELLKPHYRCIAVDLPGNGYSSGGDLPYGIGFFADCVHDFLTKMKLQNVVPVGHSMGGQTVTTLALRYPEVCRKLVLCAPAGFETFTHLEKTLYNAGIHFFDFFSTEENSLRKVIRASFFHYPAGVEEMLDELVHIMKQQTVSQYRRMIEACIKSMLDEPVYPELYRLQQDTLVIFGDRDALIPNRLIHPITTRKLAEEAVQHISKGRLEVLPRCGHFLPLEKPEKVAHLVQEFIG